MNAPLKKASATVGVFDFAELISRFPETADTMLLDTRMTDEPEASSRLFRVYKPVPAHYHATCDEYLMVVSGRGKFYMADLAPFEVGPGQLLFFKKKTVHGIPEVLEEPFVVLSVDTPRRDPRDIVFVDPKDGTPDTFIADLSEV